MHLEKTEKGVLELSARQRTLGLKERAVLLLADGQKPDAALMSLVQVDSSVLDQLMENGYLHRPAPIRQTRRSPPPDTAPAPLQAQARRTHPPRPMGWRSTPRPIC